MSTADPSFKILLSDAPGWLSQLARNSKEHGVGKPLYICNCPTCGNEQEGCRRVWVEVCVYQFPRYVMFEAFNLLFCSDYCKALTIKYLKERKLLPADTKIADR